MNTKRIFIIVASLGAIFVFLLMQSPTAVPVAKAAVTPVLDCTNWQSLHPDWFYCQDFEHDDGGLGTFEVASSNGVRCNNAGQNSSCAYSNIIRDNYGIPPYPDVTSYTAKTQTFFVKYSVKVPEYFFTGPGSHGYYLHGTGGAAVIDPWPGYGAMNNIEWDEYTRILLRGSGYQRTSTSFEGFVPKQRGQWHTYQAMIVPSNSDPSVGRIKVWIDGELANDTKTDTLPSYTDFTISNYWHSNEYITKDTLNNLFESYTAPLHPAFEILFDNLVLSNKFIEDATNTFTLERVKYNSFSAGSFKVNFDTTLPATGKIEWGQTTSYGSQAQESSASYTHSLALTNLQPSTQYYLRISATDASNRTTESLTTFTTTAGNVVPQPKFSSWQGEVYQNNDFSGNPVFIKNFNDLSYVSWAGQDSDDLIRTDQSMAVRYTKTQTFAAGDYTVRAAAWDGIRVFVDGQAKVNAPGATGGYMKRRDFNITLSAGNHTFIVEHIMDRKPCPDWECKQGKQLNFAIVPLDTTAPKLLSQAIYNLPEAASPTRPYFTGKCDEDCKATIDYGLTAAYGSQLNATYGDGQGTAMTMLPAAQFPSLTIGQTYHYRVTLADNAGNQRVYTDQTFVVGDTIPPQQITNVRLARTNSTTLRLTFTAPGNSGRYGQAASYDVRYSTSPLTIYTWPSATKVASLPAPHTGGTAETINVPGLPSGQTYYFGITATDAAGNTSLLSNIASNPQGAEVIDMDGDGYGVGSSLGSDCNDYDSSKYAVSTTDTSGYCVGSTSATIPSSTNGLSVAWSGIVATPASKGGPQVRVVNELGAQMSSFFAYDSRLRFGLQVAQADIDGDNVNEIVVAPGQGATSLIKAFELNGTLIASVQAYAPGFMGGANLATGDFNGDRREDFAVVPILGGGPQVRVYTLNAAGNGFILLDSFFAFSPDFRGGVNIAAGDTDSDGTDEIVLAPRGNAGPQVRLYRYNSATRHFTLSTSIIVYQATFRGGVQLATGDIDADGADDIVTSPYLNGGPNVRVFKVNSSNKLQLLAGTMAYASTYRGTLSMSVGDLDGDGYGEIVLAPKTSGNSLVKVLRYASRKLNVVDSFMAYDANFRGGVNLFVNDVDGDGYAEVMTSPASNGGPNVRVYDYNTGAEVLKKWFWIFPIGFRGGVNFGK